MQTRHTAPELRSSTRVALMAGIAAAGISLLAGCGGDAKADSTATTVFHTTTTAPTTTAPTTTVPETTAPHAGHHPDTSVAASTAAPNTDPPGTEPIPTAPQDAPSQIDVTATDYAFDLSSDVAAAGPVTFTLTNAGSEPHQMHIAAVPEGVTAASFVARFQSEGEMAAFQDLVWSGGVNGVEPGASQVATTELAPGHYIVLCFIPSAGEHGMPHVSLGMIDELDVIDTGTVAPEPMPVATVALTDFAIAIPDRFTGGVVEVVNDGSVNHELILMRFHDGKSLADLAAWSQGGMPPERPFDYVGGTGTIAPKTRAWATLTLDSGDYVALCVVRGPTDQPHVDLGMITPFSVS